MKALVIGDVHWSQFSSIVRKMGNKYSVRLENLINSVNWAENFAKDNSCDMVIYLGDFFDKSECNAMEISALKEIEWYNNCDHIFLVGNHEAGRANLEFNTADIFNLANFDIVSDIETLQIDEGTRFVFIPYILEENRKSLNEYITPFDGKTIIFSHNDIKGIQMGMFISKDGFSKEDINANCDLFINGHLHNGATIDDKIINIGNLTGQNFSEDASKYKHKILLLDTDAHSIEYFINPFAFNFYQLDFTEHNDIDYINQTSASLGNNVIATIKCLDEDAKYLRARFDPNCRDRDNIIPYNCNMIETKFIVKNSYGALDINNEDIVSINHLDKFKQYMIDLLGASDILNEELIEVCK